MLQKSTDNGQSWTVLQLPVMWSNNIYFLNDKTGWVTENMELSSFSNDSSSVYYTNDGGEHWTRIITVEGEENDNVYFSDQNNGWFSSNSWSIVNHSYTSRIFNTKDGGKTFNVQYSFSSNDDPIADMFFLNESKAWALTFYGKVIRFSR
ncbi:MAG: WD40/YVTN/BNR-like repeat-containing protein [Bacillota bacterium]